jgi:DNA-directed RNA polymerase sigma subunit (sigma70/sigma32)
MTNQISERLFASLLQVLKQLTELHERLRTEVELKTQAMRRADMNALREHAGAEPEVVGQITERNGLRLQLMDQIGEELSLPPKTGRVLRVRQLAERLVESQRDRLLAAAEELREAAREANRCNRTAHSVARAILEHLRVVIGAMTTTDTDTAPYEAGGKRRSVAGTRIFEAMG